MPARSAARSRPPEARSSRSAWGPGVGPSLRPGAAWAAWAEGAVAGARVARIPRTAVAVRAPSPGQRNGMG